MTQGAQPSALGQPRGVEWGAAREAGSEGGDMCLPAADSC